MNDYYLKGVDVFHYSIPSTVSWMLRKILESRNLVPNMIMLNNKVKGGKFSISQAYRDLLELGSKLTWRC